MADFGPCQFGRTRYNNESILFHSQLHDGYTFEFTIKKRPKNGKKTFWKCTGCHQMQQRDKTIRKVPLILTQDGRLLTNPDAPKNPHFCQPRSTSEVTAEQFRYVLKTRVETTGKRPRQAYNEVVELATLNLSHDPETLAKTLPSFKKLRATLYRSYSKLPKIKNEPEEEEGEDLAVQTIDEVIGKYSDYNAEEIIAKHSYEINDASASSSSNGVKEEQGDAAAEHFDDRMNNIDSYVSSDRLKEALCAVSTENSPAVNSDEGDSVKEEPEPCEVNEEHSDDEIDNLDSYVNSDQLKEALCAVIAENSPAVNSDEGDSVKEEPEPCEVNEEHSDDEIDNLDSYVNSDQLKEALCAVIAENSPAVNSDEVDSVKEEPEPCEVNEEHSDDEIDNLDSYVNSDQLKEALCAVIAENSPAVNSDEVDSVKEEPEPCEVNEEHSDDEIDNLDSYVNSDQLKEALGVVQAEHSPTVKSDEVDGVKEEPEPCEVNERHSHDEIMDDSYLSSDEVKEEPCEVKEESSYEINDLVSYLSCGQVKEEPCGDVID